MHFSKNSQSSRRYQKPTQTNSTRSRSRSRSNSHSPPSQRSHAPLLGHRLTHTGKISKGGLLFTGSVGATLPRKKEPVTPQVMKKNDKVNEFKVPQAKNRNQTIEEEYAAVEWEDPEAKYQRELEADRNWYDQEESQVMASPNDYSYFYQSQFKMKEPTSQSTKPHQNIYKQQREQEHNKWELNRLQTSGFFHISNTQDVEMLETTEQRVLLMTHDIKPPFLTQNTAFQNYTTKQQQIISVLKDPQGDFAKLAKKGSEMLKRIRENKEKEGRERFWEVSGSKMGQVIGVKGVKEKKEVAAKERDDGEVDYKSECQYADMFGKQKSQAVSEFSQTKTLKQQREFLPIYSVREELVHTIHENKVIIIVGETGSGKTTQLTQYLKEEGYGQYGIIGCTQPRRVAAVTVAKRVSEEMDVKLGEDVGYAIRFEDCTSKKTIIKYMTDGVLLRESLNDDMLEKYSAIIMDEAHERSLNTDVLFGILKNVAQMRRDIKIIVTSATMNAQKFSDFFGGVAIFQIPGRTFPVQIEFSKVPVEDYLEGAVKKAIQSHINLPPGDILIFMTGQEDIEATCLLLQDQMNSLVSVPPLVILPIYSQLSAEHQAKIFSRSEFRKCIVATNIAETSLTLDGVKYVIDTGFCKLKIYNPKIGMDSLQITPIAQSNSNQRSGRAGRTGPGIAFRMYTDCMFRGEMLTEQIPELQRTNLCNVVLLLKSLGVDNLLEFEFMDMPAEESLVNAMYQLWVLGALDNLGHVTKLGTQMGNLPVDPVLAKMLLESVRMDCVEQMLTIVAMLSVQTVFVREKGREEQCDAAREKLAVAESDHLTLWNVFERWKAHQWNSAWCKENFLNSRNLRKAREIRAQLKDILVNIGVWDVDQKQKDSSDCDLDIVRKAVCSAYFVNAARIQGIGEYVNLRTGVPCKLHPSSALYNLGYAPDYVVYHEIVMTSKEYMQCVTTVDPYWLAELGPMFFSIKQQITGNLAERKQKSEVEKNTKSLIEQDIQKALEQQSEIKLRKQQQEEIESLERRMKSECVAAPGRAKTPFIKRTQTPQIN